MAHITLANYKNFKPSEFINSWKFDYEYFLKNVHNEKLLYDAGEIAIIPFLEKIPINYRNYEKMSETLGYTQIAYDIEMLFFKIAIGSDILFEFNSLYPDLHNKTLIKINEYMSSQIYTSANFSNNFRIDLMIERINHITKILKNDGF